MKGPLSVERLTQIRELFEEAFAMPESERTLFLDKTCGGDRDLHGKVSALLVEADSVDSPFEDLVSELIWPTLESLSNDPSKLQRSLKDMLGSDSGEEDPLIGKSVSRFEILAPIGRGGMGMVYRAHDRTLDRTVALKFLPPSLSSDQRAKDRFIHEAKAASGLNHPNIATVYEIGETADQQLFIAMGYYPGETLKEMIARGPIAPNLAIDIAVQLTSGMKDAHGHGVIHRDIKPGNIMISEEGTAVLLDFGLAKLSYETGYTQVGQMAGTLAYMSPEQARSETIDQGTDIWSFGVVLYEMLSGRRPFGGENAQSAIRAILEEDPEPPVVAEGEVPEPLKRIIGLCLAKNPDHRYQNAQDLLEDLQRAREGLAPAKRGGRATWNRRSRRRWGIVSGVSAVVLAVGIVSIQPFLASERYQYTFTRITEGAIVEEKGKFACTAWGDYNDDGFVDLAVADNAEGGFTHLYRNKGDGTFDRITEDILVADQISPFSISWADQDNDGDLDFFATTHPRSIDAFYRNDGDGTFSKVTEGDWVNTPGSGVSAAWGDFDNDGFADLYLCNHGAIEPERNFLYHNMGDGTMEAVNTEASSDADSSGPVLWTDYDDDGDLDLFVANQEQTQFRNDGHGAFTWISPEDGGIPAINEGLGTSFSSANYDNDRDLDLLYTTWNPEPSTLLYRNEFKENFLEEPHLLSSDGPIRGLSSAWGDYDNDGHQDLFITNHTGKNLLYHNEGSGHFERITDSPLVSEGNPSAGCAWADYDNDGDLDLIVSNGMWSEFEESCELFRNDGGTNHWIVLKLIGTISNRSAIGSKVWARATIEGQSMNQLREIGGGGHGNNQPDMRVHFGLGDATIIDSLRIEWPSGQVQEMRNVAANQFLTIIEDVEVGSRLAAGEAEIIHSFEDDPPLYASPEGIALDQNGNIFVSLRTFDGSFYAKNEIIKLTPSGESTVLVDLGPAGPHGLGALGLATDAFGNVYAAFSGGDESNGVWKISPDGRSEHLSGSENINVPNSLTFDEHGNLYLTDCFPAVPTDPGLVWRYGPGGVFEIWASGELLAPDPDLDPLGPPPPADPIAAPGANGIVFAPPNHIYVANTEKCLILDVLVLPDGSAGDISIVAGAYPPTGPPGLLFAPDGLALDAEGNLYTVAPPVGFTGFPLSPVIRITPATGEVEAILEPILEPSPLFDFPTTLAFGAGPLDHRSLFVVGITARIYGFEGSGPKITQVGVGVAGHTGK